MRACVAVLMSLVLHACAPEPDASLPGFCEGAGHPRLRDPLSGARQAAERAMQDAGSRAAHCAAMELEIERTLAFVEGFNAASGSTVVEAGRLLPDLTETRIACDAGQRTATLGLLDRMGSELDRSRLDASCPGEASTPSSR